MEGIIFQSPIILGGVAIVIGLLIFELRTHSTGYVLPTISALLTIGLIIYSILSGATLQEIAIILMVLLIVNIMTYKARGDK